MKHVSPKIPMYICYVIKTKFEAERLFMEFVFALDVSHYAKIMEGFSQTVLFVFLSYLDKKILR